MTLELARSYVDLGWPVFPCNEVDKNPLTPNGFRGASLYDRIVERWWQDTPEAMVGIPTGERTGMFVLDIDVPPKHEDGRIWLADMEARHGALPETRTATTASGGKHIFFNHVPGVRNKAAIGKGVDCRGEGGYVIAPGSVTGEGEFYEWDNPGTPFADAPRWLLDVLLPREPAAKPASTYTHTAGDNEPYVERAVESEMKELAATPKGQRGYQLNASAYSMGQLVGAGVLSRHEAEARLMDAAMSNGVLEADGEREVRAKIRRGMDAGERQPRHIPERTAYEGDNTRLVDITKMIANGLKKAARTENDDAPADEEPEPEPEREDGLTATGFVWRDPSTLPRREFVYGTHFIRKYVSVTSAPGGLGKTSLSIAEALAMITGRRLHGHKPERDLRVWLFNSEDPRDELDRRIMAGCMHWNISADEVNGRLFVDTGREQELVIAKEDRRTGVRIMVPIVEAVVREIRRHEIDVMIIDPFVSTHEVNENDNGQIDKVAKLWAQIADRTNCAIDIVHHVKKTGDREATVDDSRGAGALLAAARSARVLNRMSEAQAREAGLRESERFSYFSIGYGKANLSPLSGMLDWRKLVSVGLGNGVAARGGRGLGKPQDHAPVVELWQMPSAEEAADEIGKDKLSRLKDRVDSAMGRHSDQSGEWAGIIVGETLGIETDKESAGRKKVKKLISHWEETGDFVRVMARDEKGAMRPFLKSDRWNG